MFIFWSIYHEAAILRISFSGYMISNKELKYEVLLIYNPSFPSLLNGGDVYLMISCKQGKAQALASRPFREFS